MTSIASHWSIYKHVTLPVVLTGSAVLCGCLSVHAADFSADGKINVFNAHNVQPLSENHVVLLASMDEELVMNDEENPWHGATGPCGGAVEIKDGNVTGTGLCTFTDAIGDKFVILWTAMSLNEQGGPVGVWELTGGTGLYASASASGEYSDVPSEDPAISTVALTGELSLK